MIHTPQLTISWRDGRRSPTIYNNVDIDLESPLGCFEIVLEDNSALVIPWDMVKEVMYTDAAFGKSRG